MSWPKHIPGSSGLSLSKSYKASLTVERLSQMTEKKSHLIKIEIAGDKALVWDLEGTGLDDLYFIFQRISNMLRCLSCAIRCQAPSL